MSESEGRTPAGLPGSESALIQARRATEGVSEGVGEDAASNEAAAAPSSILHIIFHDFLPFFHEILLFFTDIC